MKEFGTILKKKNHNFTLSWLVLDKTHLKWKTTLTHTANMVFKQDKWKISILAYLWNQLILSNHKNKLNMQNSCLQLFKQVYDDANKWIYTSPCAHAPM